VSLVSNKIFYGSTALITLDLFIVEASRSQTLYTR